MVDSVISAVIGRKASDKAADTQQQQGDAAIAEQRRQFNTVQQNTEFSRAVGQNAMAQLADILGVSRPTDTSIGLDQNLQFTGGRPIPRPASQTPVLQQGSSASTPPSAAGITSPPAATQATNQTNNPSPFSLQELFAAQNLGTNTQQIANGKSSYSVTNTVGSDRLRAIRDIGDLLQAGNSNILTNPAFLKGRNEGLFRRAFNEDELQSVFKLLEDAAAGNFSADDFYSGKFGQNAPQAQQPTTQQPLTPQAAGQQQLSLENALSTYNNEFNAGNTAQNSTLATQVLNALGNSQLDRNNILAGNITNSLPALFDIIRGEQDTTQQFIRENFENDPGYQARIDSGEKAIRQNAARAGTLGGGQVLKDLLRFNQNEAQNAFDSYATRTEGALSGLRGQGFTQYNNDRNFGEDARRSALGDIFKLAGLGDKATTQVNSAAIDTGNNVANTLLQQGNARASGIIGGSNATINGISDVKNQMMKLFGVSA